MCVPWTNIRGPFRGPHYEGLLSKNYLFKRTFLVGTRKCPHNLNRPHFPGVFSYECPHKCAGVSAHTHISLTHWIKIYLKISWVGKRFEYAICRLLCSENWVPRGKFFFYLYGPPGRQITHICSFTSIPYFKNCELTLNKERQRHSRS